MSLYFLRKASTTKVISSAVVAETGLHPRLKNAFQKSVGPSLTPVQEKCIDEFLESKGGIVVRAKTGTGKTYAFGIPVMHSVLSAIDNAKHGKTQFVNSVIFAPTRDLCFQTQLSLEKVYKECLTPKQRDSFTIGFGRNSRNKSKDLIPTVIGQTDYGRCLSHFNNPCSPIVVASPGRFMDMLSNKASFREKFIHLENIIIDEADELLNGNFKKDINDIIDELSSIRRPIPGVESPDSNPSPKTMLFSATINEDVFELAEKACGTNFPFIDVTGSKTEEVNKNITQRQITTPSIFDSYVAAFDFISKKAQDAAENFHGAKFNKQNKIVEGNFKCIVFLPTTNAVDFVSKSLKNYFNLKNIDTPVTAFHGKMSQSARDRSQTKFRDLNNGILVASGIGARGMDFANVTTVIQIGVCSEIDQHTHKIGRTGRNGRTGEAILFSNKYEGNFIGKLEDNNNEFEKSELQIDSEYEETVQNVIKSIEKSDMDNDYIHSTVVGFLGNYRNASGVCKFNMSALALQGNEMVKLLGGEGITMSYRLAQELHLNFDRLEDEGIIFTGVKPRSSSNNSSGNFRNGRNNKRGHSWSDKGERRNYSRGNDRKNNDRRGGGGYSRNNSGYSKNGGRDNDRW